MRAKSVWWHPLDAHGHVLGVFFCFEDGSTAWCYPREIEKLEVQPPEVVTVCWRWRPPREQWVEFSMRENGILREVNHVPW